MRLRRMPVYKGIQDKVSYETLLNITFEASIYCFSRSLWPRGLRPSACWDRGFESHRGAWMFVVECLCSQVEVSATGRSHVERSPTDCGMYDQVKNKNPRHLL
jgi:hypothetical protein